MSEQPELTGHYGPFYRDFADEVYAEIRREEFGEDSARTTGRRAPSSPASRRS